MPVTVMLQRAKSEELALWASSFFCLSLRLQQTSPTVTASWLKQLLSVKRALDVHLSTRARLDHRVGPMKRVFPIKPITYDRLLRRGLSTALATMADRNLGSSG